MKTKRKGGYTVIKNRGTLKRIAGRSSRKVGALNIAAKAQGQGYNTRIYKKGRLIRIN